MRVMNSSSGLRKTKTDWKLWNFPSEKSNELDIPWFLCKKKTKKNKSDFAKICWKNCFFGIPLCATFAAEAEFLNTLYKKKVT